MGKWQGLRDPMMEKPLKVQLDFMMLCGFSLLDNIGDETNHCRFRNALIKGDVFDDFINEVNC